MVRWPSREVMSDITLAGVALVASVAAAYQMAATLEDAYQLAASQQCAACATTADLSTLWEANVLCTALTQQALGSHLRQPAGPDVDTHTAAGTPSKHGQPQ